MPKATNENVKTESKLRTRLLTALKLVMEQGLPLDEAADVIVLALDCDPGHDATAELLKPCADRTETIYIYRSLIRSALGRETDGGGAF